MRVAIVHDWLNGLRGGEKVLEALLELFPDAPIYTLFYERGKSSRAIESRKITTSWLDRIPGVYAQYRNLLPLFPLAAESLDLSDFDLVISSSHAVAKGVRPKGALHVCYCHTPMRYVWDAEDDYRFGPLQRAALTAVRPRLRHWDCSTARRVDHFIANSWFVSERIRSYYGRQAQVIYPPVDVNFFTPPAPNAPARGDFFLAAGALVAYKRFDVIIDGFKESGRRLRIAGDGPEYKRLRACAPENVEFLGRVSNNELRELYRQARAFVVAAREDFGIMTVEAQACGCPVIACAAGGSLEIVQDGINGIFYAEQCADDIVRAVRRFETAEWPADRVRSRVERFSRETFQNSLWSFVVARTGSASQSSTRSQTA